MVKMTCGVVACLCFEFRGLMTWGGGVIAEAGGNSP